MLQAGTICCRSWNGDFLLGESDFMKNLAEGQLGWGLSIGKVRFHEESGGGSAGGGLQMTLGRSVCWRSQGIL